MKIYCTKRSNSDFEKFVGKNVWVHARIRGIATGWVQIYEIYDLDGKEVCKFRICPWDPEDFREYGFPLYTANDTFRYGRIHTCKLENLILTQPLEVLTEEELFGEAR